MIGKFKKGILGGAVSLFLLFGLSELIAVYAATTPSLGVATTYGILSSTYINTTAGTTVNGDVGFTTGPAVTPGGVHPNYGSGAPYATAGVDQGTALTNLNNQACTFTFAPGAINLATDTTHGPIGVYTPGVYCTSGAGAASIGTAGITLSGAGTYIFRVNGALTSVVNSSVTLTNGAAACDVFWTPTAATTLGANSTFAGTNIDDSGITIGSTVTWVGRALAFGGTVSTDSDTITVPTCASSQSNKQFGTLTVIKKVINDNGRNETQFSLFVDGDINGRSSVNSGISNSFPVSSQAYTVSEAPNSHYTLTFSGDCDSAGKVFINQGDNKFCIATNDDIGAPVVVPPVPPIINVVKVPSPLALPNGPGPVTY
ncbi:MAG: ice-binding family protein, partial [bacterium]|nr:ice-binding family protein [bacterium]